MRFQQSTSDFPLTVRLGEKTPTWGLSRWGGNSGLRFAPSDDEGFTLCGNRQRLVYKGRRRSHRFTILGDTAFEYDCILVKEPESNVITLLLEGAGQYDFFRQPDFVPDPFLKDSYAVYKKEILLGEGTGKLCHIHRPEIIDARGRRCWGALSVVGSELHITIPEHWLAEATYPVIVDPTIGTTTIGSQITGPDPNNSGFDRPWLDNEYALNKYLVPQNGSGICTAYVYCYSLETESFAMPCLYTSVNNKPNAKKTQNEKEIRVEVWPPSFPVGWKNNTFSLNGNITAGEYVWFGLHSAWFTTRFDYGGECYKGWFDGELYEDYPPPFIHIGSWDTYCTIKWSWYFNYTAVTSQNYVRTLTQGIKLSDNRNITANYKRLASQTLQTSTTIKKFQTFYRKAYEVVKGFSIGFGTVLFLRKTQDSIKATDGIRHWGSIFRGVLDNLIITGEAKQGMVLLVKLSETVYAAANVLRGLILFVRIVTGVFVRDYLLRRFLKARQELTLKSAISREIVLESKIG